MYSSSLTFPLCGAFWNHLPNQLLTLSLVSGFALEALSLDRQI